MLVTGLSGAGLSTALKSLEDIGYKAVDNLPLALVDALLAQKEGRGKPVAIGIDSRTWDFSAENLLRKKKSIGADLVFIDCQDNILQQRFTETRRLHPLAVDRPVSDGIALERRMMKPLRKNADYVIDTTELKAHDLKRILGGYFRRADAHGLLVCVMSFGFKHGVPREADMVMDMRFLDNPHWNTKLRPLTGLDAPVAEKISKDAHFRRFFADFTGLLTPLLPRYDAEGKNYLTIALGCTGGRHRSVFTAEEIFRWLDKKGYSVAVRHRDIDKAGHAETENKKPPAKEGSKKPPAKAGSKKRGKKK